MADLEGVLNWQRLDEWVTTSGQPTQEQLASIASLGVRHVVNLGLHSHERALPDEGRSVADLGMSYVHMPVDFRNPTEADFDRFCSVLAELSHEPVHLHCIMNYRVSAFVYRYRRDVLGWDEARARTQMVRIWTPERVWAEFVT